MMVCAQIRYIADSVAHQFKKTSGFLLQDKKHEYISDMHM